MARIFPVLALFAASFALRAARSVAADPAPPPVFPPETLPIGKVRVEILELARPEAQRAIESPGGNDSASPAPKMPPAKEDAGRDASWDVPIHVIASRPALLDRLKDWRLAEARAQAVPAFVILHDRTLAEIARQRPDGIAGR